MKRAIPLLLVLVLVLIAAFGGHLVWGDGADLDYVVWGN
jgi:hypothetical protein